MRSVCSIRKGRVSCFLVPLRGKFVVGRARSKVYVIKNLRANRIDINLDMDQSPVDYIFMQDAKFLVVGTSIFPIKGNQIDSITVNMDKRVPIALVKTK